MQFLNALSATQWMVAATIPAGVVALYFLKLRRQPIQVPSTYLWQKSIEDLHVNSLFQRLRRNLLLFLQLLILALALLALLRPALSGADVGGQQHIILIDNSASMASQDLDPTRLEAAKTLATTEVIDEMASDDEAMIVSFNDEGKVVCNYTNNRGVLRDRIASITQTERPTNMREALILASGRANPRKYIDLGEDEHAPVPKLHIFSDGGFTDIEDFALGNLEPRYYPIGQSDNNVGIVAMMVRRNEDQPDRLQVFCRVRNFSKRPVTCRLNMYLNGALTDAFDNNDEVINPDTETVADFDLQDLDEGVVELRLEADDDFKEDNRAWSVIGRVRKARVCVVANNLGINNRYLDYALTTKSVGSIAEIDYIAPEDLESDDYRDKALAGHYDLIVYEGCAPEQMPQSNTLFFGSNPPTISTDSPRKLINPLVARVDDTHPLFRYIVMNNVIVAESLLPDLPEGTQTLVESDQGPLVYLLNRDGFYDCVFGFGLRREVDGQKRLNTNWFSQFSFPLFVFNALRTLGRVQDSISEDVILPGQTVALRGETLLPEMMIKDPNDDYHELTRNAQGLFVYNRTDTMGVYEFRSGRSTPVERRFAVNLFDPRESTIKPREKFEVGHNAVASSGQTGRSSREVWRWLILAAFGVLITEWYVYNRRVYI